MEEGPFFVEQVDLEARLTSRMDRISMENSVLRMQLKVSPSIFSFLGYPRYPCYLPAIPRTVSLHVTVMCYKSSVGVSHSRCLGA